MPAKSNEIRKQYDKSVLEWMACWELRCCLDDEKMHAYEQYFKKYAKDKVIIDLGTGPGIMGYLALKNGAKKVYCIDYIERYLNVAKKMLSDFDNVEFILGDAGSIKFPEADIIVHEIFGHNVFDEFIFRISHNLHKQNMLDKITPKKIEWVTYKADLEGPNLEHRLYVKDDFPELTQEFHQLYIERVENFNETNIKYEPYFENPEIKNLTSLGFTDLTHIDLMTFVPKKIDLSNYVYNDKGKNLDMYGWHAYLDDEIKYSNIMRPNNNWCPMPSGKQHWKRFKDVVTFGENKNPLTRGIKCPFFK